MIVTLGDPHNFGRKVSLLSNGLIHKPRSLILEKIFLDSNSTFRKYIDSKLLETFKDEITNSIFPDLKFSDLVSPLYEGDVTKLELDEITELTNEVLIKMGISIGVCSYFGIGDLHDQNMAIGRIKGGEQIVCSPLDIECIFSLCRLTSQTLLIPSKYATYETCGLKNLFKLLPTDKKKRHESITTIVYAYSKTIEILKLDSKITDSLLSSLPNDVPIRVIIRDTQVYYDYQKKISGFMPILSEEIQLKRGDIPFFYRRIFTEDIKWLSEDSKDIWGNSKELGDFDTHKDSKIILEKFLQDGTHPAINDLEFAAPLQIFRNLFPSCEGDYVTVYKGFKIESDSMIIKMINNKDFEWSCKY